MPGHFGDSASSADREPSKLVSDADYAALALQAAMQRAQAALVAQHSGGTANDVLLLGRSEVARELREWSIPCDAASLYTSLNLAVAPPRKTTRIAMDGMASEHHCDVLKASADAAMVGAPERNGHSNVAVGAVGSITAAQRREGNSCMLDCRGDVVSRLLIYKTRLQIMEHYDLPELYESGSVITRIACPTGVRSSRDKLHYACLHVDKANIASYDYSALIYLSDYGSDFDGGKFAFCDNGRVDHIVEPRKGRLVAFTSGPENLHQVRNVTRGTRYVLAMWFTCSRELGLEVQGPAQGGAASVIQVSTLGQQKEVQSLLTCMRRDIDEVLTGIRVSNFAEPPPGAPDKDLRYAGTDVHDRILCVLRKYHDNPPVAEMCKCLLGEGGMQLDENADRDILFFPREEHMRHYVTVLDKISRRQAGAEIAKGSEEDRLQHVEALFLNLLVLWHSRQWVLARAFMLHGGVQALMALQAPAVDAQIRWNGVEVLARLLIEHPDGWEFDWMDPIDSTVHPDHALHRILYAFAQDPPSAMLQVDILSGKIRYYICQAQ